MKSTRKHELQTNVLADSLGQAYEAAKPHANVIGYAVLGLIVVILAVILVVIPLWKTNEKDTGSSGAMAKAMSVPASDAMKAFLVANGGSPQAPAARLLLADRLLAEAVRTASPDAAKQTLKDAKDQYELVVRSAPSLEPMAKVGLALVTIQEGNVDAGLAALEEIVKQNPQSLAAINAQTHIDALKGYKPVTFTNEPPDAAASSLPGLTPTAPAVAPAPEKAAETPSAAAPAAETPKPETPKP